MSERVSPGDIVYKEGTGSASVVGPSDALEWLLPCRVPDLKLNVLLLDLNGASSKLDTNGQVVLLTESFVRELEKEAWFADTYAKNQESDG